jgi:hypothetical protein
MRARRAAGVLIAIALTGAVVGGAGPAGGAAPTTWTGEIEVFAGMMHAHSGDHHAGMTSQTTLQLRVGQERYALVTDDAESERLSEPVGQVVVIGGQQQARTIDVTSITMPSPTSARALAAATVGSFHPLLPLRTRHIAVVTLQFTDSSPLPADWQQQIQTNLVDSPTSLNAFYRDMTGGALGFDAQFFGTYNVPFSRYASGGWYGPDDHCPLPQTFFAARDYVAGLTDISQFDHVLVMGPDMTSCPLAGAAYIESDLAFSISPDVTVFDHEIGHNLGRYHASAYDCPAENGQVVMNDECTEVEYGDTFDVMGLWNSRSWNGSARARLGLMSAARTTTVTGAGTFTLKPSNVATDSGTQLLRIPRRQNLLGTTTEYLDVEFRANRGLFDFFPLATDPVVNGVTLRVVPVSYFDKSDSFLVDTVPGTAGVYDAPLLAGRSVTDPISGATVKLDSAVPGATAQVTVDYPAPPPPPGAPVATVAMNKGELTYKAERRVTNNVAIEWTGGATHAATIRESSGGSLLAGKGCFAVSKTLVRCDGVFKTNVQLGDNDDTAKVTGAWPSKINGGDGNDTITGSPVADTLNAGPGDDTLLAAFGGADKLTCGKGTDTVDLDGGDKISGCEIRTYN